MLKVDKAIYDTNKVICDNISKFDFSERGLLSQNILAQIRNFTEYVVIKAFLGEQDVDPYNYDINVSALKQMKCKADLRFLYRFHEMLQKSVSHYTLDEDASERLMLKYYEHLLKIKVHLKQTYNMEVLENIQDFPINTDDELSEYYNKIADRIEMPSKKSSPVPYQDRYYIQKVKPFFVNEDIYYEVTFTAANANASKFDRVIAFTKNEVMDNYAVKLSVRNDEIDVLNKKVSISIIDDYVVSIRPCEIENFADVLGMNMKIDIKSPEYNSLMRFITSLRMSLSELVCLEQVNYDYIKDKIISRSQSIKIYKVLDQCRTIIKEKRPGKNVISYLLYKMNNRIIKQQRSSAACVELSELFLKYECIPFDSMPYCSSLCKHNPKMRDLLESIPIEGRTHELFARYIKNNIEINGMLFTPRDEIKGFEEIDKLINMYNSLLYKKHKNRELKVYKNYVYIEGYVNDCSIIISNLQKLSSCGISQYTESVDSWLEKESYYIDDDAKKEAIRVMFANSRVALIYGSAGTGKSTMIKHIANFWGEKNKLFIANTHPAVDNMMRKVTASNSNYSTIASVISKNSNIECDILFIDECSTVSNNDMKSIIDKVNYKLLVLVGDVFQIESIYFGNWFDIARKYISNNSIFELMYPFRTLNEELRVIWDRVRKLDDSILEPMVKSGCVERLNEKIFEKNNDDEIILCLNYDGLYGINNINRLLQNNNPNPMIVWGINNYKVGDPVLFNEANIFAPLIHNNSKGWIVSITPEKKCIWFEIALEESINELDALGYDFELVGKTKENKSIIKFSVNKFRSTDEDEDDYDTTIVPFQVAYAVSIHKAQGLEYDSVKIIITNEIEERITHNIFYTAITRAKEKLKIFWSPETEQAVLERLCIKDSNRDAYILSNLTGLKMVR